MSLKYSNRLAKYSVVLFHLLFKSFPFHLEYGYTLLQHQVFQRYYYFCPNHLSLCSKSFPSNFIHVLDTCFSLLHILHEHTSI